MYTLSEKERASTLLESVPDYKIGYVIAYLEGLIADESASVPNAETIAAMQELDNGGGTLYTGSTSDIFAMLDREADNDA